MKRIFVMALMACAVSATWAQTNVNINEVGNINYQANNQLAALNTVTGWDITEDNLDYPKVNTKEPVKDLAAMQEENNIVVIKEVNMKFQLLPSKTNKKTRNYSKNSQSKRNLKK